MVYKLKIMYQIFFPVFKMVILFNFVGGARGGAYFQFFRIIIVNIDFRYRNT